MSVSSGPYQYPIPFVNIAEIKVALPPQSSPLKGTGIIRSAPSPTLYELVVTVQLSNEMPPGPPAIAGAESDREVAFGNYVYLSPSESDIRDLQRNMVSIRNLVSNRLVIPSGAKAAASDFILHRSDFKPAGVVIGPTDGGWNQDLYSYSHTEVITMAGQNSNDVIPNLYALVVSYRREEDNSITVGNVCRQVILQDQKVPQEAELYVLAQTMPDNYGAEGTVWPGSVHPDNNGEMMAGIVHAGYSHPVVRPQSVPNIKIKDMRVLFVADSVSPDFTEVPPKPVISAVTLSRNKTGTSHGYFAFDHVQYIKENSSLRGIITHQPSLINSMELKDIIIYHKKTNAEGSCGLGSASEFIRVASLGAGCRLFNAPGTGTQWNVGFVDPLVKDTAGGSVEYRVELLFVDKTRELMKSLVEQLNQYLTASNNAATVPTTNQYNPIYELTITTYLELIEYLFGPQKFTASGTSSTKEYWYTNLMAMAYGPQEGDSERSQVLRAIAGFSSRLSALINKSMIETTTSTQNFESKIYNSAGEALLRFEKIFPTKLKINGPANTGLSYVDNSVVKFATAMPNVTLTSYASLLSREQDKYDLNATAQNVNQYACLSPSYVGLGSNNIVNVGTPLNYPTTDSFLAYLSGRLELKQVTDNQNQTDLAAKKLDLVSLQGVSVDRLMVPLATQVLAPALANPPTAPAADYLSPTSEFYVENLREIDASGSQASPLRSAIRSDLTNAAIVGTLIESVLLDGAPPPTGLNNTDLLTGFLPYLKTQQTPSGLEYDPAAVICNFGSIGRVEYLSGYNVSVEDPTWSTLTPDAAAEITGRGAAVCRIIKMDTLPQSPLSHLRPLASLFILGNTSYTSPSVSSPPDLSITTLSSSLPTIADAGKEILYSKNIASNWNKPAEISPSGTAVAMGHRLRY